MSVLSTNKSILEHLIFSSLDYLRGNWETDHAVNLIFGLVFLRKIECQQKQKEFDTPYHFDVIDDWCPKWSNAILEKDTTYHQTFLNYLHQIEACHESLNGLFSHLHEALINGFISEHLLPFLKELCQNKEIIDCIESIEFGDLFNNCLNKLAIGLEKNHKKIFTPRPVNEIISHMLNDPSGQSIIDPAVGFAGTLIAIINQHPYKDIHIVDNNPFALILARMNLIANGVYHFTFSCNCAITEPSTTKIFDRVVCHLPIGLNFDTKLVKHQSYINIPFDTNKPMLEGMSLFIQRSLHLLNDDGKMAILIPTQHLQDTNEFQKVREYMIKRDWVESVISLPYGLLQRTSGPISLILLNKNKSQKHQSQILFVNATELSINETTSLRRELTNQSTRAIQQALMNPTNIEYLHLMNQVDFVKIDEIQRNRYNLDAKNYASLTRKKLNELARVGSLIQMADIINPDQPSIWFNQSPPKPFPYVRIGDLGFTYSNYPLRVENCIMSDQLDQLKGQLISQSSLLINRSGDRFLASYFEHEGTDILVDESILCLDVDKDKIVIDYLIMKMFDKLFIEQINLIKKEDQNKDINLEQFKKLCIEYFTKSQQEKWVKNRKIELLIAGEKKVNQLKNDIYKGKLKAYADQMRIISSIQHELGNKLPAVLTEFKNLRFYLDELSAKNEVYHTELSLYEPDMSDEEVDSFGDVLNRIEAILTHSIHSIDATSDIIKADRSKMSIERVDLREFFDSFLAMHQSDPAFSIQIEFEENAQGNDESIYTNLDRTQFHLALSNLVENAKRHGFVGDRRYVIHFQVGFSADQSHVIIVYKNDGKAFPDGYTFEDFIGYGNYAGTSGHSGIGGYLIHRIIENHNGTIRFLGPRHVSDPYKVTFEISIPIS